MSYPLNLDCGSAIALETFLPFAPDACGASAKNEEPESPLFEVVLTFAAAVKGLRLASDSLCPKAWP